ncbi:Hemerythrin HHE cation binding domain-containing protein [Nocardioides terrae]|uniref:Hemerythrin HHE cation binding domain-containing protein n=1 Tax=Nocardioides terrae TaxID=574651 RepID=A0A1I1KVY8_9ACTN|nr:hemerythrin domain-containing protein [Nocardioides terrae]SFC64959.1 Hemerythrin HHE cation binding domain-containing protein [Nocardioides terrae]
MDITELILFQHHEQRRQFALLDEVERGDVETLAAVWRRLAVLLEVHAEAEERYFYPEVLRLGHGGPGSEDGPGAETEDAIKDHNDIRDAIRKVAAATVGSEEWWAVVREAREANSEHMAEEEREDLADFRQHADLQTRHDIAVRFATFEARHWAGLEPVDKDPGAYVAEHR